jgi:hypothetical protein
MLWFEQKIMSIHTWLHRCMLWFNENVNSSENLKSISSLIFICRIKIFSIYDSCDSNKKAKQNKLLSTIECLIVDWEYIRLLNAHYIEWPIIVEWKYLLGCLLEWSNITVEKFISANYIMELSINYFCDWNIECSDGVIYDALIISSIAISHLSTSRNCHVIVVGTN